ncbi:MAG: hypothetical protein NC541_11610 [bacterium]|nr:hypothetical protein [bacterium]
METGVIALDGLWQADIGDGKSYPIRLPGTLDENRIGHADSGENQWHPDAGPENGGAEFKADGPIATRFTRKYTFEGEARLSRRISLAEPTGKRVFLEAERARVLRLLIDGAEVPEFREGTVSTPHVFEVTGLLNGTHEVVLLSDNSYPGLPHDAICYSSAATDETQTNWNGILGYFRLRVEESVFPEAVRVYPAGSFLTVKVDLCADRPWSGEVSLVCEALKEPAARRVSVQKGTTEVVFDGLPLCDGADRWDEYEGNLQELTASVQGGGEKTVTFGIRDFGAEEGGRLALNGRTFFLRGEANCAVFPESGYAPMSVEEWIGILRMYQSYGVNCMRFHSHCPPEAAFAAADRLGMMMQPELSHWNPKDALESEESFSYYRRELLGILRMLANHPSFVMLTLGNELHASEKGHVRMSELLAEARRADGTRLYANGSNVHYGAVGCDADSDFYTSQKYFSEDLRGTHANMEGYINRRYPDAKTCYDETMRHLRESYEKPVFSFEVGQFEILPDFEELEEFQGISEPANLKIIQKRVEERGLAAVWKRYVEATGELSRIGYREEIEAVMRTEQLSGISLLGLQDFPGQGTALVGMLNSHLKPKPYGFADPKAFRAFFTDRLPLVLLPKYTYENTELLQADVKIANYGKEELSGALRCELCGSGFCFQTISAENVVCPPGRLTEAGTVQFALSEIDRPTRLELTVSVGNVSNRYPVWVYPPVTPVCPETVFQTERFDVRTREALKAGRTVYLTPPSTKEALPCSIQAQFTTDFWSVGTFAGQEGGMGQLIEAGHPLFRDFPTEFHTNWQWWPMASRRAVILPKRYEAIVTEMDSYATLRPMAQLLECRCGKGKLLFSAMGLQDLQMYPEARALLSSVYRYLDSEEFQPVQEIEPEVFEKLVR